MVAVRDLWRGRHRQAMRTQRAAWMPHQRRMASATLLAMPLPMGRGAIASAVRRVINLRLQGASLVWCRARAEAILRLRSSDKAGRWKMLTQMATSPLAVLEA
jgi:hypothetical protein